MKSEIKLYGEIGFKIKAANFVNTLSELESEGCKHLTIHFHSAGGDVIEGNAIFNAIQQSTIHIKIIIDGIAASMASIIILAADEVEICENAFVMVHRPTSGGGGNADDITSTAKVLRDMENNFARSISIKSGLKTDEIKSLWLNGSDHWLNSDEAVKYGFANRKVKAVAKDVKTLKISAQMDANTIYNRFAASLNIKKEYNSMKKKLIEAFSLQDVTEQNTDDEIIEKLVEEFDNLKKQVDESAEENINSLLISALNEKRIMPNMEETYRQIGKTSGITALTSVLGSMKPFSTITSMIKDRKETSLVSDLKNKSTWTLDDYRKHAPNELKNNPKLYATLCERENMK